VKTYITSANNVFSVAKNYMQAKNIFTNNMPEDDIYQCDNLQIPQSN